MVICYTPLPLPAAMVRVTLSDSSFCPLRVVKHGALANVQTVLQLNSSSGCHFALACIRWEKAIVFWQSTDRNRPTRVLARFLTLSPCAACTVQFSLTWCLFFGLATFAVLKVFAAAKAESFDEFHDVRMSHRLVPFYMDASHSMKKCSILWFRCSSFRWMYGFSFFCAASPVSKLIWNVTTVTD